MKVRLVERALEPRSERFTFEIAATNSTVDSVTVSARGRASQHSWVFAADLTFDDDQSVRQGVWVYRLSFTVDFARLVAEMPIDEEVVDVRYELGLSSGRLVRTGLDPAAGAYGKLRPVAERRNGFVYRLTPYPTFRARQVAYRVERFTEQTYSLLRVVPYFTWILAPVRLLSQIWLVGEVPYKAQDNGFHFFQYAVERRPRRVFYVIREDVAGAAKIPTKNVVYAGSAKHVWLSVLASRLVGSHHSEYLLASRSSRFVKACRGTRIFLQHGVTATKNVVPNYGRLKSVERPTEKFLVVSDAEQRIVVEDFGYRTSQVPVVGFARYDKLFEPIDVEKRIIFMPTWRDSLKNDDSFLDSAYYDNWNRVFMESEAVLRCQEAGFEVTLLLHPNMRSFAKHFAESGIEVLDLAAVDVQKALRTSSILITDFSSVAWDFGFLNRPVVYFHFDSDDLVGQRAPHVDFSCDLPGPQAFTPREVWAEVISIVDRGGAVSEHYGERAGRFLTYRDQNNCARTYDVVARPGTGGVIAERLRVSRVGQSLWWGYRSSDLYYRSQLAMFRLLQKLPKRNVVLFEADRGTHFSDSPRAIYDALRDTDFAGEYVWVDNSPVRRYDSQNSRKVRRNTPAYFRALARSRYWVTNQNFRVGVVPGPDQVFLQTWHGTPLKRMQFDVPEMQGRADDYEQTATRQSGAWSYLLSPSPYATRCFRSAFRFEGRVLELGYPRNDVLALATPTDRLAVRRSLGIAADDQREVVLYAPTFRDDMRSGVHWRHALELDLQAWTEEFGEKAILLIRLHPLVRGVRVPPEVSDRCIDVSKFADVQQLLLATDILVTDYSSIFFDFSILRRPAIFYAYDFDKYEQELRGFYLPYEESLPGPVVTSQDELFASVHGALGGNAEYPDWDSFLEMFAPLDDGKSAQRVVKEIFDV